MNAVVQLEGNLRVNYGQFTSAGLKPENEDCLGVWIPEGEALGLKGIALVIADGVSAAGAGKEAGELCVRGFLADYFSTPETWLVKTSAHRVLASLNQWLYSEGRRFVDEHKGFISAMSAMVIKSRTVHVFHVGDTRVYRLRDGALEQVTNDHSTWGTAKKSFLNRAMGLDLNLDIDYWHEEAHEDDVYLLTTDGVHDHVNRRDLERLLKDDREDLDQVGRLIGELALQNGSADNISVQLIRIETLPTATRKEFCEELGRLPFPPDLRAGHKLDGYEVLALLDTNPRGQLYHVRDIESGDELVMKTPSRNFEDDPAYIERFVTEEWIGKRVSHSHLVRVVEKRRAPNFLFYLMERVRGSNLEDWIRENPRPDVNKVVDVIDQAARGLRSMHRRETLHQDLKPANIMIEPDGNVKIIDLGSASAVDIKESRVPIERGRNLGTTRYSAPEYRLGRRPTIKSDLFSLALIAYGMLTGGRHPYGERFEDAGTLGDFRKLAYTPAAKFNPLIANWMDGALRKALSINPEHRHEALSEFVTDLRRPNPDFVDPSDLPLLERDPVLFWKVMAGGLFVIWLLTLLLK
ncbi:MAG: bifunctional protein-serine/threonine kinase/phosphatase [Verrucomicrobiae bacterium]|nr:bifunctional protein-serine/threonine kinase/phosphatase [Verrucomicrobiae bacterium]